MEASEARAGLEIKRKAGGNGAASGLAARNPAAWAKVRSSAGQPGGLADEAGDASQERMSLRMEAFCRLTPSLLSPLLYNALN